MPSGLGRGLDSLIPKKINQHYADFELNRQDSLTVTENQILHINPNDIKANPYQPRQDFSDAGLADLMSSIKEHGIIQPLVITKTEDGYELIAGERRLRSAKALGLKEVPVILRSASKQKKLELALIENLQRENLNSIETAIAYNQLMNEFNLNQEDAAKRVGKPRSSVANTLRLLNLPTEIQQALAERKITEAHAKYLLGLDSEAKQINVFKKILRHNMSVRETNEVIGRLGGTKEARVKTDFRDEAKEAKLRQFFGTKAKIKRTKRGGQVIIDFYNDEELDTIMHRFN